METKITVRYAETDQMGIAHHSNYAIWFEAARTEFIKELGISYSDCEKRGLMLPLISLECQFKKPALYDEVLVILSKLDKLTPVRMVIKYEVRKEGFDEIIATGKTGHVWTDLSLRPINLKKKDSHVFLILQKGIG
ncbi:MAG: acyl-CoA thioesterase [Clostridiales bacterium]|nr:acyl-CoA thioesterase [Clostridiales bacterium]